MTKEELSRYLSVTTEEGYARVLGKSLSTVYSTTHNTVTSVIEINSELAMPIFEALNDQLTIAGQLMLATARLLPGLNNALLSFFLLAFEAGAAAERERQLTEMMK